MSDQPLGPQFEEEFWMTVHQRVDQVRTITRDELERAGHLLLTMEGEAEVVPVFPGPFWARVSRRAAKVRQMALDELEDAEERLVNQPGTAAASRRGRIAVPALRRLPHLPPMALPLKGRVNTLGFVTAVLAVLLLLPQVVPISSLAGIKPRGPLAILFSIEDPEKTSGSQASSEPGRTSGESSGESSTSEGEGGGRTESTEAGETTPARSGSAGSSDAPKGGSPGAPGSPGQPATGSSANASPGADGTSTQGATSAGSAPTAPSDLLVTAVNDTTVSLTWTDNSSDETGFVIERRGQTGLDVHTTEADAKSYIWSGLSPGTESCFRVRARSGSGASDWFPQQYRCATTHSAQTGPAPGGANPEVVQQ